MSLKNSVSRVSVVEDQSQSWQQAGGVALRLLAELDRKRLKLVVSVPNADRLKAA